MTENQVEQVARGYLIPARPQNRKWACRLLRHPVFGSVHAEVAHEQIDPAMIGFPLTKYRSSAGTISSLAIPTVIDAILDRLIHKVYCIEFAGESRKPPVIFFTHSVPERRFTSATFPGNARHPR